MNTTLKTIQHFGDKPSIVFFGSGPVAAASLQRLTRHTTVEAVITKPKPSHHRGRFPVIETAEKLGIPLILVNSSNELSITISDRSFRSTIGILIDFGIIVTKDVIERFPHGILNSHFSILPEWRGADPITFSLLSGQEMTGVSLMVIAPGLDEGPLVAIKEVPLSLTETNDELTKVLVETSDQLLEENLGLYMSGEKVPFAQEQTGYPISYSKKLSKTDGIIDWSKAAEQIEREIRAYSSWPKSRTNLAHVDVIITRSSVIHDLPTEKSPGTPEIVAPNMLVVHTGEGALSIEQLKPAGKKEMTAAAFIAGYGSRIHPS